MAEETKRGTLALFAAALAVNWAFDGFSLLAEALAPPHLLLRYASELVSHLVSPWAMALTASPVLAAIGVLLVGVVPRGTSRRFLRLTAWLSFFFILAEGLLGLVWLSAPGPLLASSVLFGLVRSAAVARALVWIDGGR